jgi:hypothetical protein
MKVFSDGHLRHSYKNVDTFLMTLVFLLCMVTCGEMASFVCELIGFMILGILYMATTPYSAHNFSYREAVQLFWIDAYANILVNLTMVIVYPLEMIIMNRSARALYSTNVIYLIAQVALWLWSATKLNFWYRQIVDNRDTLDAVISLPVEASPLINRQALIE